MRRWLLAAALVGLTLTGNSTALACDYAPALSVDEVLAAGPGGTVPFFGRQVTLVGVVEHGRDLPSAHPDHERPRRHDKGPLVGPARQ